MEDLQNNGDEYREKMKDMAKSLDTLMNEK